MERSLQKEDKAMTCVIWKTGETAPGKVTVTLERGPTVLLVKEVPAQVCGPCGEYHLDEHTTRRLYEQAEKALERNAELEVLRYAA